MQALQALLRTAGAAHAHAEAIAAPLLLLAGGGAFAEGAAQPLDFARPYACQPVRRAPARLHIAAVTVRDS